MRVYADMIPHIIFNTENLAQAVNKGYATATDLADYLVAKGVAFRDAHEIVGQAVRVAIDENKQLDQLSIEQFQLISKVIAEDVYPVLQTRGSAESKQVVGGTSPEQVRAQIKKARNR